MVARSFYAFDSEALAVTSDSPSLTAGSSIINNAHTPDGTIFQYDGSFQNTLVHLDDTSGDADTLEDGQHSSHVITEGSGLIPDGSTIDAESLIFLQEQDGSGNPVGPVITVTVFSKGGVIQDVWGFSSDTPLSDGATYVKTGGSNDGTSDYESFVPCFVAGSRVMTKAGPRRVESIQTGDLVFTRDNGFQPVLWVGKRVINPVWLAQCPHLQPICIKAHAFGPGQPAQDLYVSPQHRLLVKNERSAFLFGETEVLAAAHHLTQIQGVTQMTLRQTTYVHLLFEHHQVVLSDGMWSESYQPGPRLFSQSDTGLRQELLEIFPDLTQDSSKDYQAARVTLKRYEALLIAG